MELVKELKEKTLEKIIEKFGKGIGQLDQMKLSIWDVRDILYFEANKIIERELKEKYREERDRFGLNK